MSAVAQVAWPLTGRGPETAQLHEAITGSQPVSLLLVGPAGVGKTRLAREAQRLAEDTGREVLWLSATHSIARTPLGVFAALLPEQDRAGDIPDLLHRSARALLERPREGELLLIVDDAHLVDDLSAGLLHQLAANHGVHVLLTVRAGEPVPEAVTALWKDDVVRRLELGHLEDTSVGELLAAVLGDRIDPGAARTLARRSGGNPLLLRELTLSALSGRTLIREHGLWRLVGELTASERVVELMGDRLRGLDEPALRLLEAVAYAEPLGAAEVSRVGSPELVAQLERHGLLHTALEGRRLQVRLAHPLVGEVVRCRTSAVRVAEIARSLGDLQEGIGVRRSGDALRLGCWRLDGGGGRPEELLRAARAARWRYDFDLAERLARAAAGFEAGLLAAQVVALQGRTEQAASEYDALFALARSDVDRLRVAGAHVDLLWLCVGDMPRALAVAERAEGALGDPELRRQLAAKRAGVVLGSDGPGPAARLAEPLLDQLSGPPLVFCSLVVAFSAGRGGRLEQALAAADRGYVAAVELTEPDDWYPWYLTHSRCEALAYVGRFDEAEALALAGYQEGLDAGSPEQRAWFLWHLARNRIERGRLAQAARDAREATELLSRLGRLGVQHSMLSLLAKAHAQRGDVAAARSALDELAALGIEQPRWSWTERLSAEAWTAVAAGDLATARVHLRQAVEVGEQAGDVTGALSALHDLARLDRAQDVQGDLERLSEGVGGELTSLRIRHVRALADRDGRQLMACAEDWERAGVLLLAAESASVAVRLLEQARQARLGAAAARQALRLTERCEGARTPALSVCAEPGSLTAAERETALLAAQGRSSREIAAHLVLSVRTVDNRLQRVYQKLGISRRADLSGALI